MCSIDFDSHYSIWEQRQRTSSSFRECDCCGATIKPGETYERNIAMMHSDSRWPDTSFEDCCTACVTLRDRFADVHGVIGVPSWTTEGLWECIDGLFYDVETAEWVIALSEMARRGTVAPPYESDLRHDRDRLLARAAERVSAMPYEVALV